jgi:hypothetical protein
MNDDEDPEIIFSDYTQSVVIDGHHFDVEIYKTSIDPGWILSVENQFGTLIVLDNPPFFGDVLAWRAFEELVSREGIKALYNKTEHRKLGL